MATNPTLAAELRELYSKESARLKEEFRGHSRRQLIPGGPNGAG